MRECVVTREDLRRWHAGDRAPMLAKLTAAGFLFNGVAIKAPYMTVGQADGNIKITQTDATEAADGSQ